MAGGRRRDFIRRVVFARNGLFGGFCGMRVSSSTASTVSTENLLPPQISLFFLYYITKNDHHPVKGVRAW
jgi:hypothetical protein